MQYIIAFCLLQNGRYREAARGASRTPPPTGQQPTSGFPLRGKLSAAPPAD